MPGALARRLAGRTGSRRRPGPQRKERKQITFESVRRERAEDAACCCALARRARPFRRAAERPCAPRRVPAGPKRVRQPFFRLGELMYVVTNTGGGSKEFERSARSVPVSVLALVDVDVAAGDRMPTARSGAHLRC